MTRTKALGIVLAVLVTATTRPAQATWNVALGKDTSQSSTLWSGHAARAVDGDTDGVWGHLSVTHTNLEPNPWWQVDLGKVYEIDAIQIWNRTDCCGDRLDSFQIFVSQTPFLSDDPTTTRDQTGVWSRTVTKTPSPAVQQPVRRLGRYVRIQLTDPNYLSLAEVRVFGRTVIYVDPNAPGAPDGTRWENAYHFLQDALTEARQSKEPTAVRVAQGTYRPDRTAATPGGTGDRTATFQLISGMTLRGGYAGSGHEAPNARDVSVYGSILSGDLAGNDAQVDDPCDLWDEPTRSDNSYHVVTADGVEPNTVLEGFGIIAGHANPAPEVSAANYGGGMLNVAASPAVVGCTFIENVAASSGGGMKNGSYSILTVEGCTFYRNYARNTGGGMSNHSSAPTVYSCAFVDNRAFGGAGMENSLATGLAPTLVEYSTFSGNVAERYAGGMFNSHSSPTTSHCLFVGNSAQSPDKGKGGAMANLESHVAVINCTFTENRAYQRGAAMENLESFPSVANSIFWDNPPGSEAGAITGGDSVWIDYSDVQGHWPGQGNIDADPCFALPGVWDNNATPNDVTDDLWTSGDYHLKSPAGRWDPNGRAWVYDNTASPCIDAGYIDDDVGSELRPNGGLINMGFYGGTYEASMSLCPGGHPADNDADGLVYWSDLLALAQQWLDQEGFLSEDLNRDGMVDFVDYAVMHSVWMESTAGGCLTEVFADSFELEPWDASWTQDSQNAWHRSTAVAVDGAVSAELTGPANNATLTSVPIDLLGRRSATVLCDWYAAGLAAGDYVAFEVSADGGATWREMARLDTNTDPADVPYLSVRVTNVTTIQLRFRATVTNATGQVNLDALSVTAHYH